MGIELYDHLQYDDMHGKYSYSTHQRAYGNMEVTWPYQSLITLELIYPISHSLFFQ